MGNFDDILKKKIASMGIARQVDAVGVVEKTTEEVAKIIPKEEFEIVSFKGGALKIAVQSSSVSSEIKMRLGHEYLKANSIKRVIFTHQSQSEKSLMNKC